MLRCAQLGLSIDDIDRLESGMVWDMITESGNDHCKYPLKAGQEQFNEFIGG